MSEYKPVTVADHLGRFGAGLVGEGCPWESVRQMAEDLGLAETDARAFAASHGTFQRADRLAAAAVLLSSGSNP